VHTDGSFEESSILTVQRSKKDQGSQTEQKTTGVTMNDVVEAFPDAAI